MHLYPLTTILSVHHTPNPNLNGLDIPRKIAATILGLRDATCNRHRQYEPRIISTQSHASTWNRRQSTDLITTLLVRKEKDSLHRRKQRICLLFSSSSSFRFDSLFPRMIHYESIKLLQFSRSYILIIFLIFVIWKIESLKFDQECNVLLIMSLLLLKSKQISLYSFLGINSFT
jgi:hypothetical protein